MDEDLTQQIVAAVTLGVAVL